MAKIYKFPDTQVQNRPKASRLRRKASEITVMNEETLESFIEQMSAENLHKAGLSLSAMLGLAPNIGIHAAQMFFEAKSRDEKVWDEFLDILTNPDSRRCINDVLYFFGKHLRLDGLDAINAYLYLRDNGPLTVGH